VEFGALHAAWQEIRVGVTKGTAAVSLEVADERTPLKPFLSAQNC
jgi:hypothetical protein